MQNGPTSIELNWTHDSSGYRTGYTIVYSTSDSTTEAIEKGPGVSVAELTGLEMGAYYSISVMATSDHLPSEAVTVTLQLVLGVCTASQTHKHTHNIQKHTHTLTQQLLVN